MIANIDLRLLAKGAGISLWQIADKLGYSDQKLYRDWRQELSESEKEVIREVIKELQTDNR